LAAVVNLLNSYYLRVAVGLSCTGSPFHPKVVSPRRVQVVGGWESVLDGNNQMRLKLNELKTIEFDTRTAGPGTLCLQLQIFSLWKLRLKFYWKF